LIKLLEKRKSFIAAEAAMKTKGLHYFMLGVVKNEGRKNYHHLVNVT